MVSLPEWGTLRLPARVHFGYGSRSLVGDVARRHGERVLAIVDPFLLGTPLHDELLDGLKGLDVRVHSDITPELPVDTLDAAGAIAREHDADVIVAVGGGSALDAAKLVALLAAHGGPLRRYYGENLVPGPVRPVVALPTTAGTGSEVTPVAVVSDPERELKVGISSPFLVPAAALVDPELTLGGPPGVTACSGIDALVHAVESYTARAFDHDPSAPLPVFTGRNALTEPVSLLAARHLGPWLPVAVASPGDRHARAEVAKGSLLAGIAFGSTGTHLCHALQYPIGALTGTPHGLGTGLLLPYVLRAVSADPVTARRVSDLGAAIGGVPESTVDATIARVVDINAAIGIPATLAEIGVRREDLPRVADLAFGVRRLVGIAPIEASRDALLHILESAHQGVLQ